ncbi:hypothetical protein A2382_03270 [Candidatus Woesebacteria bacterium RIFOXYB1_FULL_38_16]|uniref:D-glycerate dehydrogenase n=1 Tax=Candidatus Woesebacteria bacterium RIFOXYB1_FULL_38_16 TaxID=1802538 RepID=A0A1F8CW23_9BACT|nr:MAG: hypothetical protein A2191_04185 [Candidatus Woesebacteria bacterium RIFOXYA1_FULL_38_9]OGM79745.1 MAG: hypothetical protein A2382_03270 [Candidatus Woesebacteria bacterium RIFOXYB1_FULL_38_16]
MSKIFISRKIPSKALDQLNSSGHDILISELDRSLTSEEFLEKSRGVDAVLSLLTDKIDGEVIDAIGPQLKIISNYAVGFDNINITEATERGVIVTNTPCDEVNDAVALHTWALILSLTRRIVEADESTRRGAYKGWEPGIFVGTSLAGKTLGIIGLGRIGTIVAKMAAGFGLKVLYNKRTQDLEAEKELGIQFAPLNELFQNSDIISLHVPLTDETHHMINSKNISLMKPGVILVNTARGPIVYEAELVEALRSGHVGGAGLDVYDNEPNINPELIAMENVVLTPHIASATKEAREKMGEMAVWAIINCLDKNLKPDNIVNPEVWDKRRK